MKSIFLISALVIGLSVFAEDSQSLIDKCMSQIKVVNTFEMTIRSTERFGTKYKTNTAYLKCQLNPFKIYVRAFDGDKLGAELLYVKGWNNNKAMVNPGKMLPNMSFDILSKTMHEDHHYSLFEAGFGVTRSILSSFVKNGEIRPDVRVDNGGLISWQNKKYHKLSLYDSSFSWISYQALPGETAYKIAMAKSLSEYLIMEKNNIRDYGQDLGGRTIQIPSAFCKKAILYLDAENYIPMYIEVYDDAGLLEKFETSALKLNPIFAADEFSTENSKYGF